MKGAIVVEVVAAELPAARRALARAVASGALGRACEVRLDGDGFVFAGGRARGRLDVTSDGRVAYDAEAPATFARWAKAVIVAAFVAAAATLGWSQRFPQALAGGAVGGVAFAVGDVFRRRTRLRAAIAALAKSLPVLVDARRE